MRMVCLVAAFARIAAALPLVAAPGSVKAGEEQLVSIDSVDDYSDGVRPTAIQDWSSWR